MLSINTNLSSLIVQSSMNSSTDKLNLAIERMTTGYKINHAKDNAANYSIATDMTTRINSYMVAEDNAMMGLDMTTAISDTLELLDEHASRIRDLCEQASNGTYGEESLKAIQSEIDARMQEIERIKANAEYNGIKLLEGESTAGGGVTGKFLAPVTQLTEDEAIAQGYTIVRTADELILALQNNESVCLMNDIDMTGKDVAYVGGGSVANILGTYSQILEGNGYSILNISPVTVARSYYIFFEGLNGATIKNVAFEFAIANKAAGFYGLSNTIQGNVIIENVTMTGSVNVDSGFNTIGYYGSGNIEIKDSYVNFSSIGTPARESLVGSSINLVTDNFYFNKDVLSTIVSDCGVTSLKLNDIVMQSQSSNKILGKEVFLQVGINSSVDSQIIMSLETLESLSAIDVSSSTSARDCIKTMDDYILGISNIQTNLGAVQNRLESVLEEITIQRENLLSSRSTIRDADMAEVSSHYIQQQILQQAAATLMSTANQSPAIALQLI